MWTLPDRSTPTLSRIEDTLDHGFENYVEQREAHRWYGFRDFGDVIHSFDPNRNMWRYDVGGYGWANSELSLDIWLWTKFLRSGRADVFRFAEAMTRHTGEVDVYHIGPQALLGTRHHVQHWGDGMKQLRISTPVYRRNFYYLTADERVGDQLREQLDAYVDMETGKMVTRSPDQHVGNMSHLNMVFGYPAFAAYLTGDEELAQRAWSEILGTSERPRGPFATRPRAVEAGPDSLHSFEIGRFMRTN